MATTIRIDNDVKDRLDRLKARLLLQGIKLTQAELIDYLLKLAEASPLFDTNHVEKEVLINFMKELDSLTIDLGETSFETIDDELYGESN